VSDGAPTITLTFLKASNPMPLHDWSELSGWDGVHLLWIAELLHWVKPRLPAGYRAYVGAIPLLAVGAPSERPDVRVRRWPEEEPQTETAPGAPAVEVGAALEEPDVEVAAAPIAPAASVYVEMRGQLVAAIELVSPRNKDRPDSRATYLARYLGYLLAGVHLVLVDVHRHPLAFSFADRIAQELQITRPPCPAPFAISYRVGGPAATGGSLLGIWQRGLTVSAALPRMVLPLTVEAQVPIDLEQTYGRAAEGAYLT
jgi:hypothetical protein